MAERLTPVDRAAIVLTALARGQALNAADIAALTGLRRKYVYRFMVRLSWRAPIYCDRGRWRWCADAAPSD